MTCCNSRSIAEPASSTAKLEAPSASNAIMKRSSQVSAVESCHQSSAAGEALYTKDLLRLLAKVNFIYGEVKSHVYVISNFIVIFVAVRFRRLRR